MKKYLYLILGCLCASVAQADDCMVNITNILRGINQDVSNDVDDAESKLHEFVYYCPLETQNNDIQVLELAKLALRLNTRDLIEKIVKNQNSDVKSKGFDRSGLWRLGYNEKNLNVICVYMPTEDKKIYRNLSYMANCSDAKNSPMQKYLDIENPFSIK